MSIVESTSVVDTDAGWSASAHRLLQRRDLSAVLFVAGMALVLRVPMSVVLLGALPIVMIGWHGLRRGTGLRAAPLWWFLVVSLVTSAAGVVLNRAQAGTLVNSFTLMVAITALAIAVFYTGRPERAARRLLTGTMWGLVGIWAIGMGEVITDVKLLPRLYPLAPTLPTLLEHRLYASALYSNYNDFCVSLVLLCTLLVARLMLDARSTPFFRMLAGIIVVTSVILVVAMGSRGAVMALAGSLVLIVVWVVRMRHPEIPHPRWRLVGSAVIVLAAAALWFSTYVQDRSTAGRLDIMGNALHMLAADPTKIMVGYGSYTAYTTAAATAYPNVLMDPHNLFLEFVLCYGLPALVFYVWCWLWLLRRYWRHTRPASWWVVGATVNAMAAPVLGVVPSSTLRYYLVYIFLVCACAGMALDHRGQSRQGVTSGS